MSSRSLNSFPLNNPSYSALFQPLFPVEIFAPKLQLELLIT